MSVWANHTNIFVFGCFWGVLDNFRGDIKFRKKSRLGYTVGLVPELGLGTSKFVFTPL